MSITGENLMTYWLVPVSSDEDMRAADIIRILVGQEKIFAFKERVSVKFLMKARNSICFYASGRGIVAHGKVLSNPKIFKHPSVDYQRYPWIARLDNPQLYLDNPIIIDAAIRRRLDAFRGKDPRVRWNWFVQMMRRLSEHDFKVLTRQDGVP